MKFVLLLLAATAMALGLTRPQAQTPAVPAPPPVSGPPGTPTAKTQPPVPAQTGGGGPPGPICECGYTYCASVLMGMSKRLPFPLHLLLLPPCHSDCPRGL